MSRLLAVVTMVALGLCASVRGATLEYLSMDDMIAKSTGIVRARVTDVSTDVRGPRGRATIYTRYSLAVSETFKGPTSARLDVAAPGGAANGLRQTFPGAPTLKRGEEYVVFFWTSRSGLTQIIGLSQGLFTIKAGSDGKPVAARSASSEPMIAADGSPRRDEARSISLADLRSRIARLAARRAVQ
jgi:hypothetical protein